LGQALKPLGLERDAVRVRTFHALGLEILRGAEVAVSPLVDRMAVLREIAPSAGPAGWRRLDTAFSRLKLDLGVTAEDVAADPEPGPIARLFLAYEAVIAAEGGLDFDDLVARSLRLLERDPVALARWRERCGHLLVDESQDLDRAQLRLALLLAAPANRIFLVGDDDQSIYGWRLADVRRVLALADSLEGLRRVDLTVNYRCPATVVRRAVRLVEHNVERFAKTIEPRPDAPGPIVLAADAADDTVRVGRLLDTWLPVPAEPVPAGVADPLPTQAILTRTNRELLPAIAAAIDRAVPFRPPPIELLVGSPLVDACLTEAAAIPPDLPLLARIEAVRSRWADRQLDPDADPDAAPPAAIAAAVLGWAGRYRTLEALADAIAVRRAALLELCRDDASLTFATAHATKGLEFDHVAVLGMERGRFPSARSLADAPEPARALEEERRLAYVAWTRARRSLTLIYDPDAPSSFLLEAFSPDELGVEAEANGRYP
jgi:superfamily I DNA/RNA helicase